MKKFIKIFGVFLLPILVLLVALEYLVSVIPNSYNYKYSYIMEHGDNIQAVAVGHSQLYDGFKPESFFLPSFNLSNSAQTYVDDYYLLLELLPKMPKLKYVILPIGYREVVAMSSDSSLTERSCYYHKYMNMDYEGRIPFKFLFESFNVQRSVEKIFSYFIKDMDIVGCDSMGRRNTNYLRERKRKLGSTDNAINGCTRRIHEKFDIKDKRYLLKTIEILVEKKVKVVLVAPPYYWHGFKNFNKDQRNYLDVFIDSLCKNYPIEYIDLEADTTFVYDDFTNELHLSEYGAEKFTRKLNEIIYRRK